MTDKDRQSIIESYPFVDDFYDSIDEYLNDVDIVLTDKEHKILAFQIKKYMHKNSIEKRKAKLTEIFSNLVAAKFIHKENNQRYIIFHPCSKVDYKYQLSFFDQFGAYSDIARNTLQELIDEFLVYDKSYMLKDIVN